MKNALARGICPGLVLVVACLLAPGSAGASSWSPQPIPPPTAPSGQIAAVSCGSPTTCVAVGSALDATGATIPLAERWDGRHWSIQDLPHGPSTTGTGFAGVSCASPTACIAVGGSTIARWDGRRWSIQRTPRGADGDLLYGVSCWGPRGCIAVGENDSGYNSGDSSAPVALVWRGKGWTVKSPAGGRSSLADVSCAAATSCMAVGSFVTDSDGDTVTLAEHWDGRRWSIESPPDAGATDGLIGVSCASATSCTSVGSFVNRVGTERPLVERWSAGHWSFDLPGRPARASDGRLVSVSCQPGGACTAVGSFTALSGKTRPLIERLSGARWSTFSGSGPATTLTSVSCASARRCTAVGPSGSASMSAEQWNGNKWTARSLHDPRGPLPSDLAGVSCTSARSCFAVGYFSATVNAPPMPLVEAWNGTGWGIEKVPAPPHALAAQLTAVSCTSATVCVAVGKSGPSSDTESTPFVAIRRAGGWTLGAGRQPANTTLYGISCASAAACVAVGARGGHMLAESWDGTSWTIGRPPDPAGANGIQLNDVSCVTPTSCIAVGYAQQIEGAFNTTLAEGWNGSSWTPQTTPNAVPMPTDSGDQLNGVACVSASACTAVGIDSGHTLAERWDGSSWTIQRTPDAGGASASVLQSVACTSADACEAVGFAQPLASDAPTDALVEGWSPGGWTLQSATAPRASKLSHVACAPSGGCLAAGSTTTSPGFDEPLAESFS